MAAYTYTLPGAYVSPLVLPEQRNDFTVRYSIPFSQITVASSATSTDTLTVTLGTTTANWVCSGAYGFLSPQVAGGIGGLAMSVGTTTTVSAFLASTAVTSSAATFLQPTTGLNTTNLPANSFGSSSVGIVAVFTASVSGTMSSYTAGNIEIFLAMSDPSQSS